ncbi:thioredoxin family protein [Hymenobacter setariae]|uniref:Thioredoxin family protein n=1 Tax=Hymenobacter setariae TaxID=2594794 RepID=A0A558BPF3_9BACT|nr:thioredoxin family protein [Hymenobacter setariae]TVT38400.1 thioredoxin family protein [Hymenobacter setariae]
MSTHPATPVLSTEHFAAAYIYTAYRQLIDDLLAEGKTTGPQQTPELVEYTALNVQRMHRLDKTVKVQAALAAAAAGLQGQYIWLIITEGWCGDAAQIVPVLEAVAQASQGHLTTRYVLRDEHPTLMDQYLTGTSRAIPKLVVLDANTLAEITHWGPRPVPARELVQRLKAEGMPHDDFIRELHTWYAHDRTQTTQTEMLALVQGLR